MNVDQMTDDQLEFVAKDAAEALVANPLGCNSDRYLDEVQAAIAELKRRQAGGTDLEPNFTVRPDTVNPRRGGWEGSVGRFIYRADVFAHATPAGLGGGHILRLQIKRPWDPRSLYCYPEPELLRPDGTRVQRSWPLGELDTRALVAAIRELVRSLPSRALRMDIKVADLPDYPSFNPSRMWET